jgi:hypothetical protein
MAIRAFCLPAGNFHCKHLRQVDNKLVVLYYECSSNYPRPTDVIRAGNKLI